MPVTHRPTLAVQTCMKNSKQLPLFKNQINLKYFGGSLLENKRKSRRPLSSKDSIHLVLRSSWAKGKDSFLAKRNCKKIEYSIKKFAKKFGVRIYQQALNGNHIHLLLRITNRSLYRAFIKAVSGQIASQVMGGQSFYQFSVSFKNPEAGDGLKVSEKSQSFWEFRPFSRIVKWGQDFKNCTQYIKQNVLEALGLIPYQDRKNYYSS